MIAYPYFCQNTSSLAASVAIVILNFNGRNYLEKFLPSVVASTYSNKKIVVADNASTDESVDFVRSHYPSVEVIINTQNDGFAGGYNWALQHVEADYYILLNSDVEVPEHWIEPVIALMEKDASIGAAQPKMISYSDRDSFEYAGACGGWIDCLGYPFSRGRIFDVLEKDNGQYNTVQDIFWATGAALFIRSNIFHQLKGFNASFFAHQEEIDLCWRIQLAGYRIVVVPDSKVFHVGAGTLPRGGRKVFLNFRNNLMMLYNNLPVKQRILTIGMRFALDAISAWKGLFTGDIDFFKAIVRAHWAFTIWILSGKKQLAPNALPIKKLKGVYKGPIVWEYFIKKKTRFGQIVKGG